MSWDDRVPFTVSLAPLKRKGLRPLSQTGLPRVPMNPRQRNFGEGGHKEPGSVLDAFNETRTDDKVLHPTKGYRNWNPRTKTNLSVKRGRAAGIVAAIKSGQHISTAQQRRFLAEGW